MFVILVLQFGTRPPNRPKSLLVGGCCSKLVTPTFQTPYCPGSFTIVHKGSSKASALAIADENGPPQAPASGDLEGDPVMDDEVEDWARRISRIADYAADRELERSPVPRRTRRRVNAEQDRCAIST